ncbi:MAG: DUF4380 domain-containing protein, partial [Kiritimatiellae bacterium]|nr:DUF4380 domain-containing protein [Kiritimatiellia bacterium]
MKRIVSLCCVLILGWGIPLFSEMETVDYQGWKGAIRLQNRELEVVVLPQTGRLLHLSIPGGENLLTFNAGLVGERPPEEEGDWLNYGGDWMWPVHQDHWEKMGGARWPPLRMLDSPEWHADVKVGKEGTQWITLRKDFGDPLYVQVERQFELPRGSVAELKVHQSIRRIQASDIPVCLWQISQMHRAEQVFFDSNPESFHGEGYRKIAFDELDHSVLNTCNEVLVYEAVGKGEHKIGTGGAWIAGRRGNQGMLLWTAGGATDGSFPDGGCSVVMYSNTGLGYTEIETQSRKVDLAPGEVLRNTVHYRL